MERKTVLVIADLGGCPPHFGEAEADSVRVAGISRVSAGNRVQNENQRVKTCRYNL